MPFFQDSTVTELIQANIERLDKLEADQQEKLVRIFRDVRTRLQDRLLTIPAGTFTQQQVRVTLVQIESAISALKRDLTDGMIEPSEVLSEQGVQDMIKEVNKFSKKFEGSVQPLNLNAALVAADSRSFLVNKYESSIAAYGEDLRSQITSNIMQGMIARETTERTVGEMVNGIGRFFAGEEWKIRRIARTELHNIYNFSKMNAMIETKDSLVPDLKKSLMHPMDHRTGEDSKKLNSDNPIVDIGQPFRFKFKGKERVFMFPPDRPNDRSILVPYRKAWDKAS